MLVRKSSDNWNEQIDLWIKNISEVSKVDKNFEMKNGDKVLFTFIYHISLIDSKYLNETIIPRIRGELFLYDSIVNTTLDYNAFTFQSDDTENFKNEFEERLFSGSIIIIIPSNELVFHYVSASDSPKRSPEESNTEVSIRGPRDGFVEDIGDNLALIRKRLKTTSLKSIVYTIGERSHTKVCLMYLDDVLNDEILSLVNSKLINIKMDVLTSVHQIEEHIYDKTWSLFPLTDYMGRSDYVVESLNQGRFAILIDGNPSCIIGPTSLNSLLNSPEDGQLSFFYVSTEKILRIAALIITLFLPGFFGALTSHHLDQVPFPMLATVSVSRLGLPLSTGLEMIIMLLLFELFKEAGIRLPKAVGQTVAVLGGLIVGDAAIRAGLTSPTMLVIIAITIISSYTLVNQSLSGNILILRFVILLISIMIGFYGFFLCVLFLTGYIVSLKSFNQPYISILANPNLGDLIKTLIKIPDKWIKKRNLAYQPKDVDRKEEGT
ncbi:spore germination protein [Peribacillus alkalitolerans]|uniref:spore germination protein n=1 Tax=Peribacillus alkalitolerans TaxID=1550385 RepID=UPI0013D0542E|nr:spore germination protein [Peribacillus alkalitolerans]